MTALAWGLAACSAPLPADVWQAPAPAVLNGRPLPHLDTGESFDLLLLGHLYGDPKGTDPVAASWRRALPRLRALQADLWYCLGDTFRSFHPDLVRVTLEALAAVPAPVCNAPGNHDLTHPERYLARFGPAYAALTLGPALLIQVDTESRPWQIEGDQLAFLAAAIDHAASDPRIRVVFVLGHKLVFAHRRRYLEVLAGANGLDGLAGPNRFVAEVLPLFDRLRPDQYAYWCAGDVGASHSLPLFFDRDPDRRIAYLATGLGDLDRDLAVLARVQADGAVQLRAVPLSGGEPLPLTDWGTERWRRELFPGGLPAAVEALRAHLPE